MAYQVFQYPMPGDGDLSALNAFLESHRVVSVQQHWSDTASGALLVFVVQYTVGKPERRPNTPSKKVDYKAVLNDQQFAIFSKLREARKDWAYAEGVPVYTLFSNEQLAEMAKLEAPGLAEIQTIEGIGEARMEKYGQRLLDLMQSPKENLSEEKAQS
ncbi:MAG: HRDC domain-containing protein [Cyanobacteria bacterium P01_A01_bin.17]